MVNMQNNYNQLMEIAKSAYGSGLFEGSNGGNGYVGQYVGADGKTHVVKILTHRAERSDYAKAADKAGTEELARATKQLKENLIAIADGASPQLGETIRKMLEDAQVKAASENMTAGTDGVGLLSRKIVAQAVSAIAKAGTVKDEDENVFSWDAVKGANRAETVSDTTANAVETRILNEMKLKPWDLERMVPDDAAISACRNLKQIEGISRCFFAPKPGGEAALSREKYANNHPQYAEIRGNPWRAAMAVRRQLEQKIADFVQAQIIEEFEKRGKHVRAAIENMEFHALDAEPSELTFEEYAEAVRNDLLARIENELGERLDA